ncbi:MAG TPA: cell cycle protein [Opitutae bacterium]|nr:cell cycle protein [Opitutae bacterium]
MSLLKNIPFFRNLAIDLKNFFRRADAFSSDRLTTLCISLLCVMGILFIYSAQSYAQGTQWKLQIIWILMGFSLYLLISRLDYSFFLKNAHVIYWIAIILLLLIWTPLGKRAFGGRNWLDFGKFSFQPSDVAKLGTLIMAASILARSEVGNVRDSLTILAKLGIVFFVPFLLIFLQPDLGSDLIFPPMLFAMLFVSNLSLRFFMSVATIFLITLGVLSLDIYQYQQFLDRNNLTAWEDKGGYESHSLLPLKDYQRNRILAFVAPELVDPKGIGVSWNLKQSLISVCSGRFFGKGHNNGTQAKLGYLPQTVAHNDFIFSVIAEEKGFLGGFFVLILYGGILFSNLRTAEMARDRFGRLLAIGVSTVFLVHIFINIGMTIGLVPITGIPLPFVSYGGSFILVCFTLQGIVQSVYRYRHCYR